jgi:AcrR family transcriptional regulator
VGSTRGQARADAILAAALALVGEIGYHNVTVDAIAARARASKMTMYRRWPTKARLIADALRRRSEGPSPDPADTGALRSDLLASVDGIVRALTESGGPSLLSLTEAVREDADLRDLVRAQIHDRCALDARAICAQAEARGEAVDAANAPLVFRLAVSHLFTTMLLTGAAPDQAEREELVDEVVLPVLRGRAERQDPTAAP